eukprot:GFUD01133417.1.p1 GENE.GFUD01133417.1~~GFUD01133417.1.p1  ORF type:complete len:120 (+),score=13.67 GFUD01133417.1:50-409(+)
MSMIYTYSDSTNYYNTVCVTPGEQPSVTILISRLLLLFCDCFKGEKCDNDQEELDDCLWHFKFIALLWSNHHCSDLSKDGVLSMFKQNRNWKAQIQAQQIQAQIQAQQIQAQQKLETQV